jgi:hypothetical protein
MPRIWPHWAYTIGAMRASGAVVRFACLGCRRLFDVDLEALLILRGADWGLIGRRARCKASKCRARGLFVAAPVDRERGDARFSPFLLLHESAAMPNWLAGTCPADHEPPPGPTTPPEGGGPPPAPRGVDPVRWAAARSDAERKRLVREARG